MGAGQPPPFKREEGVAPADAGGVGTPPASTNLPPPANGSSPRAGVGGITSGSAPGGAVQFGGPSDPECVEVQPSLADPHPHPYPNPNPNPSPNPNPKPNPNPNPKPNPNPNLNPP